MQEMFNSRYYHPELMMKQFRDNLLYLRQQRNLTQGELADVLGISQGTIANYETGKSEPSVERLYRISRFFETDMDTILIHNLRPPKPIISLNLKYLREKGGFSKEDIAKLLEFPTTHLYSVLEDTDWVSGMNIHKLQLISEFYGVTTDDLLKKDLSKEGKG